MRTITLTLYVILISIFFVFIGSCETAKKAHVVKKEELYGTWINEEHDDTVEPAKWDFNPDGTWAIYPTTTKKEPTANGIYTITEKWTDDFKNIWYEITWEETNMVTDGYGLIRIDSIGTNLEVALSRTEYPTVIDRNKTFMEYSGTLYRQ